MNTVYFLKMMSGNIFGKLASPAIPSTYYIGMSSTAPNTDGTGVSEPSGGSYARVAVGNSSIALSSPDANALVTNKNEITFPESTANWGRMTHYVVYDALNAGNLLMYGELVTPRTVETATTITIKPGQMQLQIANPNPVA